MDELFDVAIIGGGINGCGCAADAALRGLSVALFEKNDLASKTSSSSTKLIHGGLRYLEQYDFSLVKKALQERQNLLELAPYLVRPLELMLPFEKHMRPAWFIRIGLFIYDHLSWKNKLPKSKSIQRQNQPEYFQPLKSKFNKGFIFSDGITNDARLTLVNALLAKEQGARIYTRTELISALIVDNIWHLTFVQEDNAQLLQIKARSIINAAGPWVSSVSEILKIPTSRKFTLVKGSHIVIPRLYEGGHAYFLQSKDKRIIFVIPYYGYSMIGTTDVPFQGSLNEIKISPEEIDYLCSLTSQYFNTAINKEMIINSWSGVRPLIKENNESLQEISRDYSFHFQTKPAPVITIYSGKITTYRRLACEAIDQLKVIFPDTKPSSTEKHPLPGAAIDTMDFSSYKNFALEHYSWLDRELLQRYLDTYGTRMEIFLKDCTSIKDLGESFGFGLYKKEIDYLVTEEWATSADDILWRRTKLGLAFQEKDVEKLGNYLDKALHKNRSKAPNQVLLQGS